MRFLANPFDTFGLGVAAGWLVTYLTLTYPQKTAKAVRKAMDRLTTFHDLTPRQQRELSREDIATDKEIIDLYRNIKYYIIYDYDVFHCSPQPISYIKELFFWFRKEITGIQITKIPEFLTAEIIICKKAIGLTELHARMAFRRINSLYDLQQTLLAVSAEIEEEEKQWREKAAAEKAAEVQLQAQFEAMMQGDPDGFDQTLNAMGLDSEPKNPQK